MTETLIPDRLALRAQAQHEAEARLGRRLTAGERHLDLWAIDDDLVKGKEELTAAIEAEKARYIRAVLADHTARMEVTGAMEDALLDLEDAGRDHARREIRSMGIEPEEPDLSFASARRKSGATGRFWTARLRLGGMLGGVQGRVERDVVDAITDISIGASTRSAVQSALERRVPGARAAAAELTSGAFTAGLDEIYSANRDSFPCWHYSAVMDGATCSSCRSLDGRRFETLEELYAVLPGFGPNPLCLGMGRCRCRGVPCPPGADTPLGDEPFASGESIKVRDVAGWPDALRGKRGRVESIAGDGTIRVRLNNGTVIDARPEHLLRPTPPRSVPVKAGARSGAEAAKALDSEMKDWANGLTSAEREAVEFYGGPGAYKINRGLRKIEGFKITPEIRAYIKALDHAIQKAPLAEDTVVFRGTDSVRDLFPDEFDFDPRAADVRALAGRTIEDAGYWSSSVSKRQAGFFADEVMMEIRLPKGHRGAWIRGAAERPDAITKAEQELLLPRGSSYLIRSVEKRGKRWVFELEVVP